MARSTASSRMRSWTEALRVLAPLKSAAAAIIAASAQARPWIGAKYAVSVR